MTNQHARVTVLMHDTLSECAFKMCESLGTPLTVTKLKREHEIALQNDQREITPKISKAELWFLRMIHLSHCALEMYEVSTK